MTCIHLYVTALNCTLETLVEVSKLKNTFHEEDEKKFFFNLILINTS